MHHFFSKRTIFTWALCGLPIACGSTHRDFGALDAGANSGGAGHTGGGGASSSVGGKNSSIGGATASVGGTASSVGGAKSSGTGGTAANVGGATSSTGGASSNVGGATASIGGNASGTGGATANVGGNASNTGGAAAGIGGTATSTGGTGAGIGGAKSTGGTTSSGTGGTKANGGTPAATGGTVAGNATGGAPAAGGAKATGGALPTGGAISTGGLAGTGGASAQCGALGTPCCTTGTACSATGAVCTSGTCACGTGLTNCSNACVDLTSNAHNCSACGHDCLGGICDFSACQPTTIVTGQTHLAGLSTDGTYVYWSGSVAYTGNDYYVSRRRVDASDAVRVLAPTEASGGGGIGVSSTSLYWLAQGHLRACQLPDCTTGPSDFISTVTGARCGSSVLFTSTKLFWSCGATYNANDGTLWSLPVPLSTTTPTAVGPNPSNPAVLVTDSSNVYWVNSSTYTTDNLNADGAVYRVRLSDGSVTALASTLRGDIGALAIGGGAVYIAGNILTSSTTSTGAVLRVPLPNGVGTTFPATFANARSVYSIVADSSYLYFTDTYSNSVSRCAIAGCNQTPEIISPVASAPLWLAQDTVSIYWATYGGAIQRLAK